MLVVVAFFPHDLSIIHPLVTLVLALLRFRRYCLVLLLDVPLSLVAVVPFIVRAPRRVDRACVILWIAGELLFPLDQVSMS